jgi:hypothetical protein
METSAPSSRQVSITSANHLKELTQDIGTVKNPVYKPNSDPAYNANAFWESELEPKTEA